METNKNKYDNSSEDINSPNQTSINEIEGDSESNLPGEDELAKLNKELEIQKDKYLRLVAEFDNFKRRTAKERMELIQTAGKDVITSMLDVLDDCDRAEKQMNSDNPDQIKEGVQLVFNKLRNTLQSRGLKPMNSIDTDFDVHKHEAIAEVPVNDESKKGKVIDEIVKGYYLNDKLIRFAKVIVGK
ncbi:MAG: heat shock protein GrpE [Chitinophagaceae bacterium]|nr:heat shock protein GrpE [Chitinophagaceae bacterium]